MTKKMAPKRAEKSNALAVKGTYNVAIPAQAVTMANVLKNYIVKQKLFSNIKGKNFAHVDGWQFAGSLMNTYPKIIRVENLSTEKEIKWKADVEIISVKDDKVVGFGTALCSNLERTKKIFEEYAILSMAQTRAIGKAYRNRAGWIMKLAGYEATPAEEMKDFKNGNEKSAQKEIKVPSEEEFLCFSCGNIINKAAYDYSKKLFGKPLCRDCQELRKKEDIREKVL